MSYTVYAAENPSADYVILSSGLGGHGSFWRPQIAALQAYFHVITYDQEGCHQDSVLLPDHYSVHHLAVQVAEILSELDIKQVHFIGHALGGHIGFALATLQKQYQFKLLSLTAINAWGRLSPHTQKCFQARTALIKNTGIEAYVRAQALFLYPPAYIVQNIEKITEMENKQLLDFPPIPNVLARLNAVQQFVLDQNMVDALHDIPVYLLANADDFLVPVEQSKQLATQITHAVYQEFTTGAHASTLTDAQKINQVLIEYLTQL